MQEFLYRYQDPYSENSDPFIMEYKILKITPKGHWIHFYNQKGKKFVCKNNWNRFAYETVEEALNAYIRRKIWQVQKVSGILSLAKRNLIIAKEMKEQACGLDLSTKLTI